MSRLFFRSTPMRNTLSLPRRRAALARKAVASAWVRLPMVEPEKKPSFWPRAAPGSAPVLVKSAINGLTVSPPCWAASRLAGPRPATRKCRVPLRVGREPEAGELPALMRIEEVAVSSPDMAFRCGARAALEHELVAHELAVILTDGAGGGLEAGIREVGACRPLPHVTEHLGRTVAGFGGHGTKMICAEVTPLNGEALRRDFPLELGRQPVAGPAGEGVRLEIADMGDGCCRVDRPEAQ